jgi:hypothetical protein
MIPTKPLFSFNREIILSYARRKEAHGDYTTERETFQSLGMEPPGQQHLKYHHALSQQDS